MIGTGRLWREQQEDQIDRLTVQRLKVDWTLQQLRHEWQQLGARSIHQPPLAQTEGLWQRLAEFPAEDPSATVLKANLISSAVCGFMSVLKTIDPECSLQSHAGNGIVLARMTGLSGSELSQAILKKLQPAARAAGGNVAVLAAGEGLEQTRQIVWGSAPDDLRVMHAVKRQFDPRDILNRGRFVYV